MTAKEERNWKRISDLEVEVGKIKVELVDMDHRLMLVEGFLRTPRTMVPGDPGWVDDEEGQKRMVGQGGESKNAATGLESPKRGFWDIFRTRK